MKSILFALLLASCSSRPLYPTDNADEKRWLQEYRDGKITWSEYQSLIAAEADKKK